GLVYLVRHDGAGQHATLARLGGGLLRLSHGLGLSRDAASALVEDGLDTRDVAAQGGELGGVGRPLGRLGDAQADDLVAELPLELAELLGGLLGQFERFHRAPSLRMKRVLIGSLWWARRNASRASSSLMPSIS